MGAPQGSVEALPRAPRLDQAQWGCPRTVASAKQPRSNIDRKSEQRRIEEKREYAMQ